MFKTLAATIVLGLAANPSFAETLFEATYKGRHTGIGITLVRKLEQKSDIAFSLNSKASSFVGSITENSQFNRIDGTLVPQRYDYVRSVFGKKSKQYLMFDWEKNEARYRREDKAEKNADFNLVDNALDPSLYQLKMQQELSSGNTKFEFDFAKDGRLKYREFEVTGESEYELENKTYKAVKVERINKDDDKETHILLIPALNYQIAKITHVDEDGSEYNIRLKAFEANEEALENFYSSLK